MKKPEIEKLKYRVYGHRKSGWLDMHLDPEIILAEAVVYVVARSNDGEEGRTSWLHVGGADKVVVTGPARVTRITTQTPKALRHMKANIPMADHGWPRLPFELGRMNTLTALIPTNGKMVTFK